MSDGQAVNSLGFVSTTEQPAEQPLAKEMKPEHSMCRITADIDGFTVGMGVLCDDGQIFFEDLRQGSKVNRTFHSNVNYLFDYLIKCTRGNKLVITYHDVPQGEQKTLDIDLNILRFSGGVSLGSALPA